MTYEEAIDELKNNYVITNGTVDGEPLFESIYLAIEALEGQILNKADGCTGCAFVRCEEWELPCRKCKRNCKDYWRAKTK